MLYRLRSFSSPLVTVVIAAFLIVLLPLTTQSGYRPDIEGIWRGVIDSPTVELEITVEFSRDSDRRLVGDIDIPAQMVQNLPLTGISLKGNKVNFAVSGLPGNPTFNGELSQNSRSLTGRFTQSGLEMAFELHRKGYKTSEAPALPFEKQRHQLRYLIDSLRQYWQVPGLAVAVVSDDRVVMNEGFGLRNLGDSLPVDARTLFAIGSCTKAFTSVAAGMLVDEGELEWNKPVVEYLPTFRLYDDYATQNTTVTDLLCHRTGVPRHELMWYGSDLSREELYSRLRYLEPSEPFRSTLQYQNMMYVATGYLIEQISGRSWEDFVREKIFGPLKMNASNFSVIDMQETKNYALPYVYSPETKQVSRIAFRNVDAVGPAGSINSSVDDLVPWLKFHLNQGKVDGTQLIDQNTLAEIHGPHMINPRQSKYPENLLSSYALGWGVKAYRGHLMYHHGGGIDGFTSYLAFLPHDKIGVAVLANQVGSPITDVVLLYIVDALLELEPIDWQKRYVARYEAAMATSQDDAGDEADRIKDTRPSHKLKEYVGAYTHPAYGTIMIVYENDKLMAYFHDFEIEMEHWHYDVFRGKYDWMGEENMLMVFHGNAHGQIDRLSLPLEPTVDEILFIRQTAEELYDPDYLKKFLGEYDLGGLIVNVELSRQNVLTVTVPDQPVYRLEPFLENEFKLKDYPGYLIEFETDKNDLVTAILFKQPNGTFRAVKK